MRKEKNIVNWLIEYKKKCFFSVKKKKLCKLKNWNIKESKIYHSSKKFFQIAGFRISSNYYHNKNWDQPLIIQNEKGILGILKRKHKGNHQYLLQAKMEPGNINKVQLSPTVQATKSNYTRAHGGKAIKYLNFFKNPNQKKILVKSNQSEQGFRYFSKFNTNMIVNVNDKIKIGKNHIWLNKIKLKKLINQSNILNMDVISVLSCGVKKKNNEVSENSLKNIYYWFNNLKKKYFIKRKLIPLSKMKNWEYNEKNISHKSKKYFSIIGIKVQSNSREVNEWEQPIIQGKKLALSGFIIKKTNSTIHYLVNFSLKPGIKYAGLSCTARTSDINNYLNNKNLTKFTKYYLKKYFLINNRSKIRYNKIQSDEGGRFFHSQIKNMVVEISEKERIKINNNYIWMSHNQVLYFIKKGMFDIEARILFSCFNIYNNNIE